MNTFEIKLTKEKAQSLTKPLLQSVELYLLKNKSVDLTEEDMKQLLEDMSFFLQIINLRIEA
jgi:hypothetical protein